MAIFGLMLGGALGTLARYLVTLASQSLLTTSFPLGTILVNVLGCYLIALLTGLRHGGLLAPACHFALEGHALGQEGAWNRASLYVLANLVLGYLALVLGRATAARLGAGAP
ncbi:MAG: CrcB family protein [Trueperaceae bacterium]